MIRGGGGGDTLGGNAGNDQYVVDSLATVILEAQGEGADTAWISVSGHTLAPQVEVGRLVGSATALSGGAGDDNLVANQALGSTLSGGAGTDTLWGSAGADVLAGGLNNDTLVSLGGADRFVFDAPGWGTDFVVGFDRAAGAKIDLRGSGVTSLAQLGVAGGGANTQLTAADGSVIYLFGVASVQEADFFFA